MGAVPRLRKAAAMPTRTSGACAVQAKYIKGYKGMYKGMFPAQPVWTFPAINVSSTSGETFDVGSPF